MAIYEWYEASKEGTDNQLKGDLRSVNCRSQILQKTAELGAMTRL